MKVATACRRLINEYSRRPTLRSGSLITTVFGDAIAPRGGKVWLGSLIEVMADFGIGERLVRTSVFRLARDGWLQSEQNGRRSYYSLTGEGREQFDQATHRIYGAPATDWDGQWCLLLLSGLDTATKERVRKECGWLGFGPMSANVLAHPAPDLADLLIQEYRKILLRDPMLPAELLPSNWQGATAYQLCRNLYRALYLAADRYLTETMETADGPLPPPSSAFLARFGGLDRLHTRKVSNA